MTTPSKHILRSTFKKAFSVVLSITLSYNSLAQLAALSRIPGRPWRTDTLQNLELSYFSNSWLTLYNIVYRMSVNQKQEFYMFSTAEIIYKLHVSSC